MQELHQKRPKHQQDQGHDRGSPHHPAGHLLLDFTVHVGRQVQERHQGHFGPHADQEQDQNVQQLPDVDFAYGHGSSSPLFHVL